MKSSKSLLQEDLAKGQKVSNVQMQRLNIEFAEVCSRWNYTLRSRTQISSEKNLEMEIIFNRPLIEKVCLVFVVLACYSTA
jgi:hypothetical protein